MPKPIIVSVYRSDASPLLTPNSACTGASATAMAYMPAPPMVIRASDAPRRSQA